MRTKVFLLLAMTVVGCLTVPVHGQERERDARRERERREAREKETRANERLDGESDRKGLDSGKLGRDSEKITKENDRLKDTKASNGVDEVQRTRESAKDITRDGSVPNRQTEVKRAEFERQLTDSGYNKSVSKDGKVTIYDRGQERYVLRDEAKSTDRPTADYYRDYQNDKSISMKIRLGEK
jgi:hypothetical protein